MKYKELFTGENGIFTLFNSHFEGTFRELFGEMTPQQLDSVSLALYGNRVLFECVDKDTWETFVTAFIQMSIPQWLRTNKAITAEYDVLTSNKTVRTKTGTQRGDSGDTTETLSANKPFNENDFKDSERQQKTANKQDTITYDVTDTVTGNDGSKFVQDYLIKEIEIRRYNFQKQVMLSIVNEICLSLYD